MNESQEVVLVRRCQAGDKEAFRMLVEQHSGTLFGTAYLMTRDRRLAEDAVQRAFIQMWKHVRSVRLRSSLKAWLIRIVVNEVNQQRRKKRVPTMPLEQVPDIAGDPDEAEAVALRREKRQSLKRALEILPPEQREVIILRYFSELTVPEIVAVTGQHEGTIKSRLSRGLDHLGDILRNEETVE